MEPIKITVYGKAAPAGSKKGYPNKRTGGVIIVEANDNAVAWKAQVKQAAGEQYKGPLLTGPVILECVFYRQRNKGDYGTGRNAGFVKDSAPLYPTTAPDASKLTRGTEDSLSGIVYKDDAQVVTQHIAKRFGEPARVEIKVTPYEADTVGNARQASLLAQPA